MFPVFRLLFVALGSIAALIATARAERRPPIGAALAALAAARGGDWAQAYAAGRPKPGRAGAENRPLARLYPLQPGRALRRNRRIYRAKSGLAAAEDRCAAAPRRRWPARATTPPRDWLKRHPPISGAGKARAAEIMIDRGKVEAGTAALRAAWIEGDFTAGRGARPAWRGFPPAAAGRPPAAARPAVVGRPGRCGPPHAAAGLGRLPRPGRGAPRAGRRRGERRPPWWRRCRRALRADPGLAFEEARWWRKKDNYDAAAQLLLAHADNPVRPAAWWSERLLVARRLLAGGNADIAYRLVQQHRLDRRQRLCRGRIPVRLHRAALSQGPRARLRSFRPYPRPRSPPPMPRRAPPIGAGAPPRRPESPIWRRNGMPPAPRTWRPSTASWRRTSSAGTRRRIRCPSRGRTAPSRPGSTPQELVRAAQLFFAAGDREHAAGLSRCRWRTQAKTPLDFAMLASLAELHGRIDLAIAVARRAIDAGNAADGARLPGHRAARAAASPSVRCCWRSCGRKAPLRRTR